MKQALPASIARQLGRGLLAASILCLGLFAYCTFHDLSFWASAERLPASVTRTWRSPMDDQQSTPGYRMDVRFTDTAGVEQVVPLSGMYRAGAHDVGKALTVYYNPNHPIRLAVRSAWNWAGPALYGCATLALLLVGWGALKAVRRWTPPAQGLSALGVA